MKKFLALLYFVSVVLAGQPLYAQEGECTATGPFDNSTQYLDTDITLKILLVEFTDVVHRSGYSKDDFENMLVSSGIYVTPMRTPDDDEVFGSLSDYFRLMSSGNLRVNGYVVNRDVGGLPEWIALYGTKLEYHNNQRSIFSDAVTAAQAAGLDVSTPNDYVKLAIIYAGEIAWNGGLNPMAGWSQYIMSELQGARFARIGIHCHEFAHTIGIDHSSGSRADLMQAGTRNGNGAAPAPLIPVARILKGWITPTVISGQEQFDLHYYLENPQVYRINSNYNNDYFIIENRGFYESMYIGTTAVPDYNNIAFFPPAWSHNAITQGLFIWRVIGGVPNDYWNTGLIYASGRYGSTWPEGTPSETDDGVPFPGVANVRVLSPWSDPRDPYAPGNIFVPNTKWGTNVGMEVLTENSVAEYFEVMLYQDSPEDASPSRPQGLQVVSGPCGGTTVKWAQNVEPDLVGYNIYRGLYYTGSGDPTYTKLNSSLLTDTTFVDSSYESADELPQNIDLYHRYRITAVDDQSKESVKSDYLDAYFTYIIVAPVLADWNMTSVPNVVCDFAKTAVYPTAITPAYRFQCDSGYIAMNMLDNLRGYWIKFGPTQDIMYSGRRIDSTAMPVNACWNIIGSISTSLDTSEVTYSPPGIRNSYFFKYNNGYVITSTLDPGGGYWVRSSQAGYFILKASGGLQRGNDGPTLLDLDRFIITDATGGRQELFVKNGEGDVELPPDPPEGAFNVRFQTGNFVQSISPTQGLRSLPVLLRSLAYPITVNWNIKPENGVTYWLWRGTGGNRRRAAIRDSGSVTIAQRLSDVVELEVQAGEARNQPNKGVVNYAMDPNSPNPFNPSTQIRFQLPEGNNVMLTVFDVLGRKVAELVNGYLQPGYHSVTWDATAVASGVYFARLTVSNELGAVRFTKMSKLLLVK
jgi:M6 family metalloprotease-like protein